MINDECGDSMEPMRFIRSGDNHSIIAVTAERYVAVVRPLQAASVCRRRRAAAVMASLVLAFVQSYSPAGANAHPPVVACRVLAFVSINLHFVWTTGLRSVQV